MKVETVDAKTCKVIVQDATPEERRALDALEKKAKSNRWIPKDQSLGVNTILRAPTEKVALVLAKALKPGKRVVNAVRFSNGKIEEVTESTFKVASPTSSETSSATSSTPLAQPALASALATEPKVATSVAAPTRGCPPPDFSPARLRAWNLLAAFLSPEQREDLERYNRFVTIGGTTGHRYMITSRTARDELRTFQRSLYDLDEKRAYCVHDWDVPPEEEMHALNILVQLPGYEGYLRFLEGQPETLHSPNPNAHLNEFAALLRR